MSLWCGLARRRRKTRHHRLEGQLRDLSGYVSEITPETLSSASLDAIAQLSLDDLPSVAGEPRLGVPPTASAKLLRSGSIT